MSTESLTWGAAGLALVAVVVLVVVDRQAARRRRGSLGSALVRRVRPASAGAGGPARTPRRDGPVLVQLARPTSIWRRIRSVLGIGVVSLAAGFTLAIALALFLFLAAFLLRQAVG